MRLKSPRIPLAGDLTEDQRVALEGLPPLNIFRTLVHAPKALKGFLEWGNYVLSRRNALPAREREIVILRVGYLCRSGYEFTQHTRIALQQGVSVEEISAIKGSADAVGWSAADQALIRATDELHADQFISERTWAALSRTFRPEAAHGCGLHRRPVHPGFDDAEHLRGSARGGRDPRPGSGRLLTMAGRLEGKIAVVVGAGQTPGETIGNGHAAALLFARGGAGVLCVDRVEARAGVTVAEIEAEGGTAHSLIADISQAEECAGLVQSALDRWGRVDILLNNAGIGGGDGSAHPIEAKAWERILSVNLSGMLWTIKAVLPAMRDRQSGAIVNISSLASIAGGHQIAYEVSKAGVNRLTTSVAQSNARYGIRCNAIAPGLMDTPMAVSGIATASGRTVAEVRAERDSRVPLRGRMGTAWDTAYAALFLASDEARFITGAILPVDGGMGGRIG